MNVNPMLAQAGDEPFDSPNYIYDLKYNGMRIVGEVENGSALLRGRSGADYTAQFPELADLAKHIKVKRAQVDGEVVCLREDGLPDFNALQNRHGKRDPLAIQAMMKRFPAIYQVFEECYRHLQLFLRGLNQPGLHLFDGAKLIGIVESVQENDSLEGSQGGQVFPLPVTQLDQSDLFDLLHRLQEEAERLDASILWSDKVALVVVSWVNLGLIH
ncbi:unnamed protein product, partial [marine sediment metagenome]